MLLRHQESLLNCCRTPVRFGVVTTVICNIKGLLQQGRGYKKLCWAQRMKSQRLAALKTDSPFFGEWLEMGSTLHSCRVFTLALTSDFPGHPKRTFRRETYADIHMPTSPSFLEKMLYESRYSQFWARPLNSLC